MAEFYFDAMGILLPAVRPTRETVRPGHGTGPRWRTIRRSRNTCGWRATSRRPVRWTRRAAATDPAARPGKARGRVTRNGANVASMMARHRSLAGTAPIRRLSLKWPIFATRAHLAGARHNGAKRVDYDEADLFQAALLPSGRSRPALCASRHRIQAFKHGCE